MKTRDIGSYYNVVYIITLPSNGTIPKKGLHNSNNNRIAFDVDVKIEINLIGILIKIFFNRHYKIFCVNGNTGFRSGSRIFYFIHLQNEED